MDVVSLPNPVPEAATNGGPAVAVVKGTRIVRRRLPRLTSAQALSDRGACRRASAAGPSTAAPAAASANRTGGHLPARSDAGCSGGTVT